MKGRPGFQVEKQLAPWPPAESGQPVSVNKVLLESDHAHWSTGAHGVAGGRGEKVETQPSTGLGEDAVLDRSYAKLGPYRLTAKGILRLAPWLPGGTKNRCCLGVDAPFSFHMFYRFLRVHVTSSLKQRLLAWGSNIPCKVYIHSFN